MIMLRSPSASDTSHAPTLIPPYSTATGTPEDEEELALLEQ